MAILDFKEKVKYNVDNIIKGNNEAMLGRALLEPMASMNSGSRKLMFAKELDQVFPLINGEKAIMEAGYEIRYGDKSSSVIQTDSDYVMLRKIPKFSFTPNHHYFAIMGDAHKKFLDVKERVSYTYITEKYGYLNNNTVIDSIQPGQYIPKDTKLRKSAAFDDFDNRRDGLNLSTVYMSLDQNYEDSIPISESTQKRYTSPLIHMVGMMIPENQIPLNIHGDANTYKIWPDIGEGIPNRILSAFRTEVKDESLFNQTKDRLRNIMMSDDKYIIGGDNLRVVDIDVYCNKPEILKDSIYYAQCNMYYNEQLRFATELDEFISRYITQGYELSYDLNKLYVNAQRTLRGDQYVDKRLFSNMIVHIYVLEERKIDIGDKLADRNGGKGVVSAIIPDELMPMLPDGTRADAIINSPTMYGRENPAQCIEVSITHVGRELISSIESDSHISVDEAIERILLYIEKVVPNQAKALRNYLDGLDDSGRAFYLESVLLDGHIDISSKPMSESFDIDKLNELYKAFPQIGQTMIYVPLPDSNGNIRMVPARRPTVFGTRYTLRLKQYGEDKFSATSLSSTNLRNENVKSKAATNYKAPHSSTCNRLGYQEANDLIHCNSEFVVAQLNMHSTSPKTRRSASKFLTDDPYSVDIKMDPEGVNRNAEIAATYMKAIGLRMGFYKKLKNVMQAVKFHCVTFRDKISNKGAKECVNFIEQPGYDFVAAYIKREELAAKNKNRKDLVHPVRFKFKRDVNDPKRS